MVQEGKRYETRVEGWASDGSGVARVQGMAVFVREAIPGERCSVEIEHVGRRAAWGRVAALLEPSPDRIVPDCPYFGLCGGCQTRHMSYARELAFKRQKVSDALTRIGGLEVSVPPVLGAARPDGYRNKAQFPVAPGPKVGFYRARSHAVVDAASCALQSPAANALAGALRRWMAELSVPAYDERTREGLIRHLFVRSNARGECLAAVVVNGAALPHGSELTAALRQAVPALRGVLLNENRRDTNVILGDAYRVLWGEDFLMDTLGELSFKLSVPSFYQVNRTQAERLYALAADFAALTGTQTVLDLYCGAGAIGLTLAARAGEVVGVEAVPQAVADARENARRNGVQNARFLHADAAQAAAALEREGLRPHVVVVDPPRKGLSPDAVEALRRMAPPRLIYVSCDPATLARDLKLLRPDYRLERVAPVDMFPRTHHVETVVLLERNI